MPGTCDTSCVSSRTVYDYDAACTSAYGTVICCDKPADTALPPAGRIFSCDPSGGCYDISGQLDIKNKLIYNVVRTPTSLYMSNLESVVVSRDILYNLTKPESDDSKKYYIGQPGSSQQSDRGKLSGSMQFNRTVPSRGNSTKYSKTSMRPGTQSPGGVGVDVKHNSYQRYLLKKKGLHALQGSDTLGKHNNRIQNNKYRKAPVIAGCARYTL